MSIAAKVKKLKDKLFEDEFEQVFKIEGAPSSRGEVIKIQRPPQNLGVKSAKLNS